MQHVRKDMTQKRLFMKTFFGVILSSLIILLFISPSASAAQSIPYKINFQGRLTNSAGMVVPDGLYNIKFSIFNALSGGTQQWQEFRQTTNRVQITNGLFDVRFGDVTALSPALFNSATQLYLEVELPTPATATCTTAGCASFTEGPLSPRQPIAASPYAFNADTVDGIDGSSLARSDQANTFSGNQTVGGNVTATNLIQGSNAVCDVSNNCSDVKIGGNSTGSILSVGTNDTNALYLKTSGTDRIRIMSNGEVMVGTAVAASGSTAAKLGVYNDDGSKVGLQVQGAQFQLFDILVVRPYSGSNISIRVDTNGRTTIQANANVDSLVVKSNGGADIFNAGANGKLALGASGARFGAIKNVTTTWDPPSTPNGDTVSNEYNFGKSGVVVLGVDVPAVTACGNFGCQYSAGDRFQQGGAGYTHEGANVKVNLKYTNNSGSTKDQGSGTWTIWYLEP